MSPSPLLLSADYLLRSTKALPTRDNALLIEDGLIRAIGPKDELAAHFPQAERLHTPGGLIMPGLVNLHTHAAMALFRGLADDLPLMRWLQDYIFPVEKTLTADMVRTGTLLSCCEMIKSGTTSFCDMYLFAGAVAEATEQSGLRAWLGEAIYDFPSPCYGPVEQGIELTRELAARYRKHPLINITAVAHAVYTCAPTLIQKMAEIADSAKIPLNIHLAENAEEIASCRERYGKSPAQVCVRFALQRGVLPMPKSTHAERIVQNADVFDFELSEEDMLAILTMPPLGYSTFHPTEAPADSLFGGSYDVQ